jgi:pilus assembly protein Flp/PilA
MMLNFIKLIRDESGAAAAEYALILAIIGSGLAVAALFLGKSIGNSLNARGTQIETCTTNASAC